MGIINYTITTLGSHSALQILKGAKDEGFKTAVVCKPDRIPLYTSYENFVDEILKVKSWRDFPNLEKELLKINAIIIPHGSFVAYLGMDQNKNMGVAYFGNKKVLDWEENRKMQRAWMEEANIKVPHRFRKRDKIDRPVIVKSYGAAGGKGYFTARNQKELDENFKESKEVQESCFKKHR